MIYLIGLSAVAVYAITGALEAGRKHFDMFGIVVIALATALGGGTLRDLLLDRDIFWISDQTYLVAALALMLANFLVRLAGIRWRITLPTFTAKR